MIWKDRLQFGFCSIAISIVIVLGVVRNPEPWQAPFFSASRFDAQTGIVANHIQAAIGHPIDCLVWPGLSGVAMGGVSLRWVGLDSTNLPPSGRDNAEQWYNLLNQAGKVGNFIALCGILVLAISLLWFVWSVTGWKLLAFTSAAFFAASQSAITQSGWVRTEGWSAAFVVLAFCFLAPEIRAWLDGRQSVGEGWVKYLRWMLSGFFITSGLLSKMNAFPAMIGWILVFLMLAAVQNPAKICKMSRMVIMVIPILIFPYFAQSFPSEVVWAGVSEYDAHTAELLGKGRWGLFFWGIAFACWIPLLIELTTYSIAKNFENQNFLKITRGWSLLASFGITGGILSMYFWVVLISPTLALFQTQLSRVLVMVAATLLGSSPYAQADRAIKDTLAYIWNSGKELSGPTLYDFGKALGWDRLELSSINSSTVAILMTISALFIFSCNKFKKGRRSIALGVVFLGVFILSEIATSLRGVFIVDFRYYIYSGIFAILAICLALTALRYGFSQSKKTVLLVNGLLVVICLATFSHIAQGGSLPRTQMAWYGRQISIGEKTAPSFFRMAGFHPNFSDWRMITKWADFNWSEAQLNSVVNSLPAGYVAGASEQSGVVITATQIETENRFQWRSKIDLPASRNHRLHLTIAAELVAFPKNNVPNIGLQAVDRSSGKVTQMKWSTISSDWEPQANPVEFAASLTINPRTEDAYIMLDWLAEKKGAWAQIIDLGLGTIEIP